MVQEMRKSSNEHFIRFDVKNILHQQLLQNYRRFCWRQDFAEELDYRLSLHEKFSELLSQIQAVKQQSLTQTSCES